MRNNLKLLLLVFMLFAGAFVFNACDSKRHKPKTLSEVKSYIKPLEGANKILIKKDEEEIANHCKRRGWNMQMTASGLWYGALIKSEQDSVKSGDMVELKYKVELLDGTELYNSDSLGTKVFEVGHSTEESGLEEGVLLMKNKEKFRFIMPPHRAHGLLGDLNKIPARSIIVYYVEVINIVH